MIIAAISDPLAIAIVSAVVTITGGAVTITLALIAKKVGRVEKVAVMTHILTNNNMAIQLKLNAELSRWKASQTKDKKDVAAARSAERLYIEHQLKQDVVDSMKK